MTLAVQKHLGSLVRAGAHPAGKRRRALQRRVPCQLGTTRSAGVTPRARHRSQRSRTRRSPVAARRREWKQARRVFALRSLQAVDARRRRGGRRQRSDRRRGSMSAHVPHKPGRARPDATIRWASAACAPPLRLARRVTRLKKGTPARLQDLLRHTPAIRRDHRRPQCGCLERRKSERLDRSRRRRRCRAPRAHSRAGCDRVDTGIQIDTRASAVRTQPTPAGRLRPTPGTRPCAARSFPRPRRGRRLLSLARSARRTRRRAHPLEVLRARGFVQRWRGDSGGNARDPRPTGSGRREGRHVL